MCDVAMKWNYSVVGWVGKTKFGLFTETTCGTPFVIFIVSIRIAIVAVAARPLDSKFMSG